MGFEQVIGQNRVKGVLQSIAARKRLPHATLFYGPAGCGMDAMAIAMALTLICRRGGCGLCGDCLRVLELEHPAFRLIWPVPPRPKTVKQEKYQEILRDRALIRLKNPYTEISFNPELSGLPVIGIDQIRSLKKDVMLKLSENATRVLLISTADRMTAPAANSLLKLLEEPPEETLLFLTTSSHNRLLPTILSRCSHIRFSSLGTGEIENALVKHWNIAEERAGFLARLSGGSMTRALALNDDVVEQQRSAAFLFLQQSLNDDSLQSLEAAPVLIRDWEKTGLQDVLRYLRFFLRDWLHIVHNHPVHLMNPDYAAQLRKLAGLYPGFDSGRAIGLVGRAIDFIEKNVYLHLIIQNLNMDLRSCILSKERTIYGQNT